MTTVTCNECKCAIEDDNDGNVLGHAEWCSHVGERSEDVADVGWGASWKEIRARQRRIRDNEGD